MGLGVRLKELSFHLAGRAALEPPQIWEKRCRGEAEGRVKGSMLGAGIGGGHGAPGSRWCHTGTFQLSKGVDAKR